MCRHGHCCAGNPSDQRQTFNELPSQRQRNTLPGSVSNTSVCVQVLEMNWWLVGEVGQSSGWLGVISVKDRKGYRFQVRINGKAIRFKIGSQVHWQKRPSMSLAYNGVLFFQNDESHCGDLIWLFLRLRLNFFSTISLNWSNFPSNCTRSRWNHFNLTGKTLHLIVYVYSS